MSFSLLQAEELHQQETQQPADLVVGAKEATDMGARVQLARVLDLPVPQITRFRVSWATVVIRVTVAMELVKVVM